MRLNENGPWSLENVPPLFLKRVGQIFLQNLKRKPSHSYHSECYNHVMDSLQDELHRLFEYFPDGSIRRRISVNNHGALAGCLCGCPNKGGYLRTTFDGKLRYNHHIIWAMHRGSWPVMLDHINRNRQDNRIENLRECTPSQNAFNQKLQTNNTTGIKGVTWRKDRQKYRARCVVQNAEIFIGHFDTIEEAKKAIQEHRIVLHGEFASNG